ncbi:MAG: radical SAM protein [Deltaproteobacteria bacterium]|nr:radical SAM protein [Deltaproteobacteria bacterium]
MSRIRVEKRVDVKVGFSCNNKCLFCVQGRKRYEIGDFSAAEIQKRLEESRKISDSIVFTGGEITIRKDFLELVKTAHNLGFRIIQIQTNGRMFAYKKFCEETIKAGANEFSPALHGHTAALHDFLTRSRGSFEQTVTGIKNLKSLNQYVLTNSVITKSNFRHLPEIASLLVRLGVDQYQFAFVHPVGTALEYFERVVPRMKMVEPYVKKGLDIGIRAGKKVMTEAIPYCIMQGYEDYIAEKIIPVTTIYDAGFVVENYTEFRLKEGKAKGIECKKCRYFRVCEGPWKEYPERYGFDEFVPVRK